MADYIFTALCGNALIRLFHFKAYSVFYTNELCII